MTKRTSHLNLRWTVGDMDRLAFMRCNPSLTVEDVARKLAGTALACSTARLREIARGHGFRPKPSLYERQA